MYSFWSAITFSFSYDLLFPCWFPLVGVLLKGSLYRFFSHVLIFQVFYSFFSNFHVSNSYLFRFLDFLDRIPPKYEVCRVFIKCYISTNVDLLDSLKVFSVGLGCITLPYEYTLPHRRIKLGPFLLWDMYVHL